MWHCSRSAVSTHGAPHGRALLALLGLLDPARPIVARVAILGFADLPPRGPPLLALGGLGNPPGYGDPPLVHAGFPRRLVAGHLLLLIGRFVLDTIRGHRLRLVHRLISQTISDRRLRRHHVRRRGTAALREAGRAGRSHADRNERTHQRIELHIIPPPGAAAGNVLPWIGPFFPLHECGKFLATRQMEKPDIPRASDSYSNRGNGLRSEKKSEVFRRLVRHPCCRAAFGADCGR